jgi:hypothetical protein
MYNEKEWNRRGEKELLPNVLGLKGN